MAASLSPRLPIELITEILLKLPPKPLLKFKCVSKSWLDLISSPHFLKTHLKLTANDKAFSYHRVLFVCSEYASKVCPLPALLYNEQPSSTDVENPPHISSDIPSYPVGSANGLICLYNSRDETFIWNPTVRKSKKLPRLGITSNLYRSGSRSSSRSRASSSFSSINYGFGYDRAHDDYKVVYASCIYYTVDSSYDWVVNIYSLRTDSWRILNGLPGGFLVNHSGKFANGKLYWITSTTFDNSDLCNIISLDLTDETWGILELPSCGGGNENPRPHFMMGVAGSDLCVLSTSHLPIVASDVWILKDCGVNISWTKMSTIKFSQPYDDGLGLQMLNDPIFSFFLHFSKSNKDELLLVFPKIILIYNLKDGSTCRPKVTGFTVFHSEIYVESFVNPLADS